MEDGIDFVLAEHSLDIARGRNIAMFEGKVGSTVEYPGIVQRGTVVKLIERDDVVMGVGKHKMAYKPACSTWH